MPHDITERHHVVEKTTAGGFDRIIMQQHSAPSEVDGSVAHDPWKEYDDWAAKQVMSVLEEAYPGHCWRVVHDSHQGVCLISIPILMGVNKFMAVNLKTHAMDSHRARVAGGEILERYGLRRGRIEVGAFLDARAKHSALIIPSREVPE